MRKNKIEGAACEWSTVVSISITFTFFRPVSLPLPRLPLSKTPKHVFLTLEIYLKLFMNTIHTFTLYFIIYFFYFNVKIYRKEELKAKKEKKQREIKLQIKLKEVSAAAKNQSKQKANVAKEGT